MLKLHRGVDTLEQDPNERFCVVVADDLASLGVSELDLGRYTTVDPDSTVATTVESMRESSYSCACVVDDGQLVGVFTQRDVLMRVIGRERVCGLPIGEEMSQSVRTMSSDGSVADGLAIMREWWVRNVPVVDDGQLVGNLSWYTVMKTMASLLRRPSDTDQSEPGLGPGLAFVDFTGLNTSPAVLVSPNDPAAVAVHQMRNRAISSLLVVDSRDELRGILTEFDLLEKLGCVGADLETKTVGEMMNEEIVALSARTSIADAIYQMAEKGYSHAPLLGESSRPVGVASFRDIASFFETSLESFV